MANLIDFVLHIDSHLVNIVNNFGGWTYLILFIIIFVETGAVVLPFLPGDSLLFAAAALAANPDYGVNIWIFLSLFLAAPILGDSTNFMIGHFLGNKLKSASRFQKVVKPEYLERTEKFFEKHGAMSITLARFMPIIRTFAPFIAAGSGLKYNNFIKHNVIGAIAWVALCCGAGYFFGNMPFVKEHFSMIIIGIIIISLIPAIVGIIKGSSESSNSEPDE
ncbi:VTT domain-containing protein [Ligilactobacillus acidipiscis]|uniref:DedA family protein n=1 Tax=Ligilactobacillus acidipiscis TaxID=89059 RepID=A0A0R2K4I2_9LACO|nr:VTT domain-containing protein [Ligilactobacillus acidipiscis]KRN84510.1 dedA family protein [Ligilactobacillus acidipiscis]